MKRTRKLVVGNWKMNPSTLEEAKSVFSKIKRISNRLRRTDVVVCPSDLHVVPLVKIAGKSKTKIGVQDVFWEDQGFFTGQISPVMALNVGASYAIAGHSEKRKLGETSEQVAAKLAAVIKDGLTGILCIGEAKRDRDGDFFEELRNQILSSLALAPRNVASRLLVIAYEPIWKVGRPDFEAMKPVEIHETVIFIRKVIHDAFGADYAQNIPILYGGSVNADNAVSIVFDGEVDGLLVGRQSLTPEIFSDILTRIDLGNER